ncbi:hypothetical protein PIB30_034235 [Stylosanthes scabra]|uniref:Uncharacterized protein n=1 Tax=Stylosanthes scabra TaxID=79078 RepID=A0ABU6UC59_9FABA|nr:hypothetical protein [Stylosanthes scabra]
MKELRQPGYRRQFGHSKLPTPRSWMIRPVSSEPASDECHSHRKLPSRHHVCNGERHMAHCIWRHGRAETEADRRDEMEKDEQDGMTKMVLNGMSHLRRHTTEMGRGGSRATTEAQEEWATVEATRQGKERKHGRMYRRKQRRKLDDDSRKRKQARLWRMHTQKLDDGGIRVTVKTNETRGAGEIKILRQQHHGTVSQNAEEKEPVAAEERPNGD